VPKSQHPPTSQTVSGVVRKGKPSYHYFFKVSKWYKLIEVGRLFEVLLWGKDLLFTKKKSKWLLQWKNINNGIEVLVRGRRYWIEVFLSFFPYILTTCFVLENWLQDR
jgi:hypothetical protein